MSGVVLQVDFEEAEGVWGLKSTGCCRLKIFVELLVLRVQMQDRPRAVGGSG